MFDPHASDVLGAMDEISVGEADANVDVDADSKIDVEYDMVEDEEAHPTSSMGAVLALGTAVSADTRRAMERVRAARGTAIGDGITCCQWME